MNLEQANLDYLNDLKPRESVIETGESGISGELGTTLDKGEEFGMCVEWENGTITSITHGAKRLEDAEKVTVIRRIDDKAVLCYKCGPYFFRPVDQTERLHVSEVYPKD